MKKIYLIAALAIVMASCQSVEQITPDVSNDAVGAYTISAMGESTATPTSSMVSSRTVIAEDGISVEWVEEDKIALYQVDQSNQSQGAAFTALSSGANVYFNGDLLWNQSEEAATNGFFAISPYNTTNYAVNSGDPAFTFACVQFPYTQSYVEDSFDPAAHFTYATGISTLDDTFYFENQCGILRLSITGSQAIDEIKVESVDGSSIVGELYTRTADNHDSGTETITVRSSTSYPAQSYLTLDCGDGVQLDSETPTQFNILIPPTSTQLKLTFVSEEVDDYVISLPSSVEIKRSRIASMSTLDVSPIYDYESLIDKAIFSFEGTNTLWYTNRTDTGSATASSGSDGYGFSLSTEQSASGTTSMKFNNDTSSSTTLKAEFTSDPIVLDAGTYTIALKIYIPDEDRRPVSLYTNTVANSGVGYLAINWSTDLSSVEIGEWVELTKEVTWSSGLTGNTLSIQSFGDSNTGLFYIDDIRVVAKE